MTGQVMSLAVALTAALLTLSLAAAGPSGLLKGLAFPSLKETPLISHLKARLNSPSTGPEDPVPIQDGAKAKAICLECEMAVVALKKEVDLGMPYDQLVQESILFCTTVETQTFCKGYIALIAPIVYHILTHDVIHPADFCGMILNYAGCNTTQPERDWSVEIHGDKPPLQPIALPDPLPPSMKILHISDTHFDPLYVPGSNADCGEQLCCREDSGDPASPEAEAWYWGDYRYCGSPSWMLEDMLTHIRNEHPDINHVMWTGDVVPHNMWSTSREWNTRIIKETNEMIQAHFPDIPVFPVIGNHEHNPLDQYSDPDNCPEDLCDYWLYEALAAQWAKVVPGLNISTVLHAGYYSVPLSPGFRIISVNSMFGYSSNIWLYENSNDVAHELTWLENELWKGEQAGELVHLLGHIPPGLLYAERTWSREYNRIVRRYEGIIRGQFFGHTHYDEFEVFHDGERPVSVAYIAPSQTPWHDLNPAYRIYTVDGERPESTRVILDHETYIMSLSEAHETNVSRWYKLYSAKETYGMASLGPEDWHQLGLKMADDKTVFDKYWRNYVSLGDPYILEGCDDVCYEQKVCDVMTSDRNDLDACYGAIQRKRRAQTVTGN